MPTSPSPATSAVRAARAAPARKCGINSERSPGLAWHNEYSAAGQQAGRVLVIDYLLPVDDGHEGGMGKVAAEEIGSLEGLRRVYADAGRSRDAVLRVVHVQNADWATHFLLRKFNIDDRDKLVGTDFGDWARRGQPERRAGKPVLNGRTWKTQHDPWRAISRTAFGVEYLMQYGAGRADVGRLDRELRLMELNCYDGDDAPRHAFDVQVQRLAVYVQYREDSASPPSDPDIQSPYERAGHGYMPRLDALDNGNAIIIFENSASGSIADTCIPARTGWESKWRRLPFYLANESRDISTEKQLAIECMKIITQDVFKAVAEGWDAVLDLSYTHVSVLEDKIYDQPADESRAPELWTNSSQWLKVEKLLSIHADVIKELRGHLFELTDDEAPDNEWLDESPDDFQRLGNLAQEDLVKPTANLADLMYKSVGIRDSRHSLQLGSSMWRLSWISFVFLPLTFMVGFFGMNVDTFADNPSIKWYFITAVPFMAAIIGMWFVLRHVLVLQRRTPYQRGVYERLFAEMAAAHPRLWSRNGPRPVAPTTFVGRLKWRLIKRWAAPEKTIRAGGDDDVSATARGDDDLSGWSRVKRQLMRRWSSQITFVARSDAESTAGLMDEAVPASAPDIGAGEARVTTELFTMPDPVPPRAGGLGVAAAATAPASTPASGAKDGVAGLASRPSSAGTGRHSGVIVEELRDSLSSPK
ncbi:MAG: hypothetical protein M1832_005562 [Thelocarpon impressellum]|nr:MAG: hypothetical protein M1832_005562 [Thelocarpon impressellum]